MSHLVIGIQRHVPLGRENQPIWTISLPASNPDPRKTHYVSDHKIAQYRVKHQSTSERCLQPTIRQADQIQFLQMR